MSVCAHGIRDKTVTLKGKWEDFTQIGCSETVTALVASAIEIAEIITPLFPLRREFDCRA